MWCGECRCVYGWRGRGIVDVCVENVCTRMDPHGSGIVMCDRLVVRHSFPGRERL